MPQVLDCLASKCEFKSSTKKREKYLQQKGLGVVVNQVVGAPAWQVQGPESCPQYCQKKLCYARMPSYYLT
jgi:hypothetical protein